MSYPLDVMLGELRRELTMRRRTYPRFVGSKAITVDQAHERIAILEDVVDLLASVKADRDAENQAVELARQGKL